MFRQPAMALTVHTPSVTLPRGLEGTPPGLDERRRFIAGPGDRRAILLRNPACRPACRRFGRGFAEAFSSCIA